MKDNKVLEWASFLLFILSAGIILLFVIFSSVLSDIIEDPGAIVLVVGAFSLLAAILGFLAFKAPLAKVGGIGGLVLLLLVLFIIPVGVERTVTPPQLEESVQEPAGYTGIPEIDTVIETVLAGDPQEQLQLLQFSTLACTHADGFGGPPKCKEDETEGTMVESFPFLGPEGHHTRRDEMNSWKSLQASSVYAVYRVSDQVYSDELYPAGEYAIVFLTENEDYLVTAQVTNGKIVRLDYNLSGTAEINLEQAASEIILAPPQ